MAARLCLGIATISRTCVFQRSIVRNPVLPKIRPAILGASNIKQLQTSSLTLDKSKENPPASGHWKTERIVSVALLAAMPAGYLYPGHIVDYSLAILIPPHVYWGFHAIVGDYLPKSLVGVTQGAVAIVSIMTFIGLLYFNYSDVGICKAVAMLWQMKTS